MTTKKLVDGPLITDAGMALIIKVCDDAIKAAKESGDEKKLAHLIKQRSLMLDKHEDTKDNPEKYRDGYLSARDGDR